MENRDWQEIVESLVEAKRSLANAWQILDGTDGAAPGVEDAFTAALSSIDKIYTIEHLDASNADIAAPTEVEVFWDVHGRLPGFAIDT